MARETKIRTRTQEGAVEVLVLVTHPMETGMRKDKASGKVIPAHFIQELTIELNGKPMASASLGIGVSENPLLGFRSKTAKNGDKLKVTWKDNKGESGTLEAVVDA
ncbi:MAG TPA: thiosulfate oxidation carrier complex protein SoxZ [Acidiferrobacterales bacterium]|nr:thiosulfate oxidation carrier complex protein SoxZ [Acidiferrobacterales bacterium]